MRHTWTATAASYAGVDLHATSLHLCVLDQAGTGAPSPASSRPSPEPFLDALAPVPPRRADRVRVRPHLVLASRMRAATRGCDLNSGHAWAMKAIHQSKTKSDAHDAEGIARLLRGGNFPLAYAYPREHAAVCVTCSARACVWSGNGPKLYGHIHTVRRQLNSSTPIGRDVEVQVQARRGHHRHHRPEHQTWH